MSLHEAFSANLTRLCQGEDSIASVCRATRINRQQFNRYLSGDSLPNERNREKICRYFKIDEPELFRDTGGSPAADDGAPWSHTDLRAVLKLIHSDTRASIAPGTYFAHFAIPHDPNSIMCSTLVVRRDGNLTTFRRLTNLAEPHGSWWSNFGGDHKGVILDRGHWLYFVGLNGRGNREPTLLTMRWLANSRPMLGGQAMVLSPWGPAVTAVVMRPCKTTLSLRSALKASHVYSIDDPGIEPIVLDALDEQCRTLVAKIRRLDLSITPLRRPVNAHEF